MVDETRVHILNDLLIDESKKFVLYWMQQSQRTRHNHTLEAAIAKANQLEKPLVVCFGLMDDYPEANERHYAFMLEGLRDVEIALRERGIKFVVKHGQPLEAALHYGKDACLIVCDRGYLRHQKAWRDKVADGAKVRVVEIEADVVVPVEVASDKHEFAARTIRPKIHKHWDAYLKPLRSMTPKHPSLNLKIAGDIDITDPAAALKKLRLERSVKASPIYRGGEVEAHRRLDAFITHQLKGYAEGRNEPVADHSSHMSMHLHFGQISPVELALRARDAKQGADSDSYLEELIVRRELSMNFVHFNPRYDTYDCLPDWAKKTLSDHRNDRRPQLYTLKELETAQTADPYWNAAQMEMVVTGFMQNYMRMYWGKCIIGWTESPEQAYEWTLHLNNKYELDGRDANSFANIAWLFGLHDRPWAKRPVFGTVRYMNAGGLERKFDIRKYVKKIDDLCKNHGAAL
jgi:deoxyribodipyrimidine photo-lyase